MWRFRNCCMFSSLHLPVVLLGPAVQIKLHRPIRSPPLLEAPACPTESFGPSSETWGSYTAG